MSRITLQSPASWLWEDTLDTYNEHFIIPNLLFLPRKTILFGIHVDLADLNWLFMLLPVHFIVFHNKAKLSGVGGGVEGGGVIISNSQVLCSVCLFLC